MVYFFIFISVIGNTTAQLLLKKGMMVINHFPTSIADSLGFFIKVFTSPWIWISVGVTFITALTWFVALAKWQLSFLFPFMALCYVLVALFSWLWFKEPISALRWTGIIVICLGVVMVSRS